MSDPYNHVGERAGAKNVTRLPVEKRAPPEKRNGPWERIRKITRLAGYGNSHIRVDPVQVAASTLEKAQAGKIKTLYVSIEWQDGSYASDWTEMPRRCLLGHAWNTQLTVYDEART